MRSRNHRSRAIRKTAIARLVAELFATGLVLGAAMPAAAAVCNWQPGTGNWGTAGNWSCGTVPTAGNLDSANVTSGKTVTVNTGQTVQSLNNGGTVNIDAFGLSLNSGGGSTNTGTVNVGTPSVTANLGVGTSHNVDNTGGVINVANGSVVNQFGSTIKGGTLNTTGTGQVVAFSNNSNVLDGVTLNGTLDLTVGNARERVVNGLTLNGMVNVANGGVLSLDSAGTTGGNQAIGGTGSINLNDAGARLAIEGTGATTLGSGITVRGQGGIGAPLSVGGSNLLINQGLISADVSGATLSLTAPGGSGSVANTGTLQATGGGILQITSAVDNTGGQINAATASVVLHDGSTIKGGTIGTIGTIGSSGTGAFRASSNGNNVLSGVTLNGTVDLANGTARERITNGATINGAVNISNGGILSLDGANTTGANQTIGGTGSINLNDGGARLSIEGTGTTTLSSGLTVRGQGNIGAALFTGGNNLLVNQGLISADVSGATLSLTAPGGSGSVNNTGMLQATGGGILQITSAVDNTGGQIRATNAGVVLHDGSTITGGVIGSSGAGVFRASSNGNNILSGVTLNGTVDLANGTARERITNGVAINGTVNIANGGVLSLDSTATTGANQTIGGTGSINLNDSGARLSIEGTGSTTLGAGLTVRGQGAIGQALFTGGSNLLVNNGLISADVSGGTLTLQTPGNSGSLTNNGTLQAVNGGTLVLSTDIHANSGSQIVAGAGSTVLQNGVTINGTFSATGGGNFTASSNGNNILNGVNFTGTLDATGGTSRERIGNGITLNGAVNIANGGVVSLDSTIAAANAVNGNATFNLNDAGALLSVEGTGSTTLGSGVVVRGQGAFGQALFTGGNNVLTNNGRVSADVNNATLILQTPGNSGSFVNNNLIDARNGGTLRLSTDVNNTGGQIAAQNGSTVLQSGIRVTGGTIASQGTGRFSASSNGNNILDQVTVNGLVDVATVGSARERFVNGATINGAVNIANGGILSLDSAATAGGNQTIGGTGSINLNDAGARVSIEGAGTTTLDAGLTVRGQGSIGTAISVGGNNTLVNNGTILADGGTLVINAPANSGTLAGTGTLQASGGTLVLATGAPTTQGRLVVGAAGSAVNLGNQNLTLTNDYTNAQSGTGNAFDRRAGVSGTGQILAGGNAAQAITGANVTGGNTANATLTLGNVRVGATTYNYQVANTGTTGPSLRGAVQTTANGANLTDSRLSGSGVTAGNYNTGAPGGNTGNLGVTFTAATAGALAPLTGQVLNLTSNFDNIADQKLNIVLASGAAAYNAAVGNATSPVQIANQRVGGSNTATLAVANTAAAGAFSEDLNVSVGAASGVTASGAIAGRVAGTSSTGTGSITVGGLNTSSAGTHTGSVTLNYQTAGTVAGVSNGLGTAAANGPQTVTVNGNVYQVASGQIETAPLNFGTVQVGQVVSQTLSIRNNATGAAGFVEDLNASFGSVSGSSAISGTGSVNGRLAGTNNTGTGTMVVNVNTGQAGAVSGSIAVNYFSAGSVGGVSNGLGVLGVGSDSFGVSGTVATTANVINQASPQVNTPTIALGNVRVGAASPTANVSVTNLATMAPQAALNASLSGNGLISGSGSFNLLAPGATNSSSLQVGMDTTSAGTRNGTATLSLVSDASNVGNCAPNCQLTLAPQTVSVSGGVYQVAQVGGLPTQVNLGSFRTSGSPVTQNVALTNTNVAPAGFQEGLNATITGTSGAATASGNFSNLAAGASSDLTVGVAGVAGANNGAVQVQFATNGATTSGLSTLNLGGVQTINVIGTGYTTAQASVQSSVNFGTVHVGDTVATRGISVQNSAPVTALNDTLNAALGAVSGPFTGNGGTVTGLTAGGPANTTALQVGLNTAAAGVYGSNATVNLASHNGDMADLNSNATVAVTATVNNYANAMFRNLGGNGTLTRNGNQFIFDFGQVVQGSGTVLSTTLDVLNDVAGPADLLSGSLSVLDGNDFGIGVLMAAFGQVGAGASSGDVLSLAFDTSLHGLGSYQDSIDLAWFGTNISGFAGTAGGLGAADYTLLIRANVIGASPNNVPEPGALVLVFTGLGLALLVSRRKRSGVAAAAAATEEGSMAC